MAVTRGAPHGILGVVTHDLVTHGPLAPSPVPVLGRNAFSSWDEAQGADQSRKSPSANRSGT